MTGDVHDFDFLAGRWRVSHRRLRNVLATPAGTDWYELAGTMHCLPQLAGRANVDDNYLDSPPDRRGPLGVSLRAFDATRRRWAIYWLDPSGALTPPVHGGFDGDTGTFLGDDTHAGQPIEVRFAWTRLGPDHARWEQFFRPPGGAWELNWVMDFAREPA